MTTMARAGEATLVSVLVPTLDEEAAIGECLDRVTAQSWPALEVIVADGRSEDATRAIVSERAQRDHRIRLIDNPGRAQSAGLNSALAEARGEIVVRLDARSFVAPDYVARCVELLRGSERAVAGGRMVPRPGSTLVARGIALANRSAWGAGPARFHRPGPAGPAETVYLGAFRRAWIEQAGGWAQHVGVNEDYELNHRIRSLGGVVWLDPSLEVGYQARSTYAALAKQYFRYGRSKATVMRQHPRSVRPRQVLPLLLLPMAIRAVAPGRTRLVARAGLLAHVAGVVGAAARSREAVPERAAAALAAVIMHWSWSAGAWFGSVRPMPVSGGRPS
jgi:succinoglycan biosynthesis protein ExoA